MSNSINLGNVAGIVRGVSPPLEQDGVTVKTYVLWGKITSTAPLMFEVHYFDSVVNDWVSLDSVQSQISGILTTIGALNTLSTTAKNTLVGSINELYQSIGTLILDTATSTGTTYSSTRIEKSLSDLNDALIDGANTEYDTLGKIQGKIQTLSSNVSGFVKTNGSQDLSDSQKAVITNNIGAASLVNTGDLDTDLVGYFTTKMNEQTPNIQ